MYDTDFGSIAKEIISSITPTPWNQEIINSWIEVAITCNSVDLYNTPDFYE